MGYGITPVAVDLDDVRAVVGSKDGALLEALTDEFRNGLGRIDAHDDPDDEEGPPLSAATVLRQIVMGEDYDRSWWLGFKYGYVFELLCLRFGEELSNSEWSAMRGRWVDVVDEALEKAGVDKGRFRVGHHIMCRGAPIDLPEPDDFPFIGYLLKHEIPQAYEALSAADLSTVDDPQVKAIAQVRDWLSHCAKTRTDLVCFYY
jgi:hypothetical protein